MKTLYEIYEKKHNWKSYYGIEIEPNTLFPVLDEDGLSLDSCESFIRAHFKTGHKGEALALNFYSEYLKEGKHSHTVSLYLLGLHLEKIFSVVLRNNIMQLIPKTSQWYDKKEFKYTWFLCALYHDVASCIERSPNLEDRDLVSLLQMIIPEGGTPLNRYLSSTVTNYLRYRKESDANDHGIIGGVLLHDKLNKAFDQKMISRNWDRCETHIENGIVWRPEHLNHYRYVADSIICHNLWTVPASNKTMADKYRDYGLNELIIDSEDKKLSIEQYPLHFMLCLLDSIEPVKRFSTLSPRDVLESISINLVPNDKTYKLIKISWCDNVKTDIGFWDWMKNIYSLPDWMQVKVSSCSRMKGECSLIIEIL